MTDKELGLKVLQKFYDKWKGYAPAFGISYNQLVDALKNRKPMGGDIFISGLGMAVREAGISDSRIEDAMGKLASQSMGKIPATNMDFFNALNGVAISNSFVDMASFVVKESAKDILSGAQAIGNQVIFTGKILNFLLPAIVLAVLAYYSGFWKMVRK